jgi:pimeloyl-ACP methyl ester carboxylesterase
MHRTWFFLLAVSLGMQSWAAAQATRPANFREEQVWVVHQPATLCVPVPPRNNLPVVVLVRGMGPAESSESRDADMLSALAHGLAASGIATIWYTDNSSTADSSGLLSAGVQVQNGVAALEYAAKLPGLNVGAEFVLGYGLGGALAPSIAQKSSKVRGVILMAAEVLPIEQLLAEQKRANLQRQGKPEAEIREELASQNGILADIRAGKFPATRMFDGAPATYWLDWMNRNPIAELQRLNIPVLVLQAGRDAQTSQDNYDTLQKSLSPSNSEFHLFAGLDHNFRPRSPAAGGGAATIDPQVVIQAWVERHSRSAIRK